MSAICPNCGKPRLRKSAVHEEVSGVDLGSLNGEVCGACGETFLTESSMRKVEERAKKAGVWGLASKVRVARSGNSLVVRIPAPLARHLRLRVGQEVMISPGSDNRLILELA